MIPLPEWAPNAHPLIIHFPIALLATAIVVDLIALFTRQWPGVRVAAVILFVLGAFGALAAFLTGRRAADAFDLPPEVIPAVTDHAGMAELTLWFFGLYALIRLIVLWFDLKGKQWAQLWGHALLFLVGAGGYYLVVQTGDLGARLVYAYGLGVQPVEDLAAQEQKQDAHEHDLAPGEIARVRVTDDASWQ